MTKKIRLFIFLPFIILSHSLIAQKKGGSSANTATTTTSSAAATSPAPASSQSGASQIEQGYNYIFPAYGYMKYKYIDSTVHTDTPTDVKPSFITLFRETYTRFIFIDSAVFDSSYADWKKDTSSKCVPFDNSYMLSNCNTKNYYNKITTIVHIDTVDRYSFQNMHISVTQGDSGLLTLGIKENYISKDSLKLATQEAPSPTFLNALTLNIFGEKPIAPPPKKYSGRVNKKKFYKKDPYMHYAMSLAPDDRVSNLTLVVKPKVQFKDTTYFIRLHYQVFQTGAVTIPYKYRFGYQQKLPNGGGIDTIPNDLSTNINIALAAGLRIGGTKFYYDQTKTHNSLAGFFGAFAGPTLIALTSTNTFSQSSKSSNQLGVSAGIAAMLELKNINFGAFGGIDFPVTSTGADWFYSNKIWLGFGIGVNLAMFSTATHQNL